MTESISGLPAHFCFHSTKSPPEMNEAVCQARFSWLILRMESLILMILAMIPGVYGGDWGVTFKNQCALRGSSVVIDCKYDHPYGHIVKYVSWSKLQSVNGRRRRIPLSDLPSPPDFKNLGDRWGDCSLQLNNVRLADRGEYFFSFETLLDKWTSKMSAQLTVKELTTVVQPSGVTEGHNVTLTCESGCSTPTDVVWFRGGHRVPNPVFQARRKDAGKYYCAVRGQEKIKSAPVALNVQYAPRKVKLSMSPSGKVVKGRSVTFTCSSDANPAVARSGYSLYKDGHVIGSGRKYNISDLQPEHSGLYSCQAWNNISWNGIDRISSPKVPLNVQYSPMNISISMGESPVVEGSFVNLTCSSAANPAADNYTWYKKTASPSSMLQVGSGQVLSIPSVEASHTGLYLCQASNQWGADNSTVMLLAMDEDNESNLTLPILAGAGVSLGVILVLVALYWWKQGSLVKENQDVYEFRHDGRSSSVTEDQSNSIYVNIHPLPFSPPPAPTSDEDEVTYSTVTIIPRNPHLQPHVRSHRDLQDSTSTAGWNDESVVYATVAKSN